MTKEDRKNAFLYCKFRDRQFALYDEYAKGSGMTMNTLLAANVLYYAHSVTQKEICQRTFLSKQTVNLIVRNLLARGYVTVTEMPENRRSKLVAMTDAGRSWCGRVVRHITWAEDTAMSMLSPEDQRRLIALSRTFTDNLTTLIGRETEKDQNGIL